MDKTLEQLNREYKIKSYQKFIKEKNLIKERYYFWGWDSAYGWRQTGNMQGYENINELKNDNVWSIKGTKDKTFKGLKNWKILKAIVIESKII